MDIVTRGDVVIARLEGRIQGAPADEVDFLLTQATRHARFVVLDLSGLEFVSSSGLRSFLKIFFEMRDRGGEAVFTRPIDVVREILEVASLLPMVAVVDDESAAYQRWRINEESLPPPEAPDLE